MDKPGLSRAIPALILGFIASLAFVYAVRVLQNMDPVWMNADSSEGAQVGMVLAAFVSMATFMWGVGAFDPKMSEHGDHADEHEEEAPEKEFALRTTGPVFRAGQAPLGLRLVHHQRQRQALGISLSKRQLFPDQLDCECHLVHHLVRHRFRPLARLSDGGRRHPGHARRAVDDPVLPLADDCLLRRAALPGADHRRHHHRRAIHLRPAAARLGLANRHRAERRFLRQWLR